MPLLSISRRWTYPVVVLPTLLETSTVELLATGLCVLRDQVKTLIPSFAIRIFPKYAIVAGRPLAESLMDWLIFFQLTGVRCRRRLDPDVRLTWLVGYHGDVNALPIMSLST